MDILFGKLLVVSSFCLRKIGNLVGFIIGVVIHPIKNIAIWITLLLSSFLIVGNVSIQLEGKDMFLMSVGLVSIMIFISSFLERQTVDIDNKDNFYLGYNIKKIKFHDNFWLRRFNELPVTLLFWLIASFPIIVICSQLKFNFEILNNVFKSVNEIIEYIKVIWLSAFVVISTYCTALLIESVALSSETFSRSYLYNTTHLYEKSKNLDIQSISGIGYKEWIPYFEGEQSREAIIATIQQNSRRYAKRQLTWFRNRLPQIRWGNLLENPKDKEELLEELSAFVEEG